MSSKLGFRSTLIYLWFRMITLGVIALVFTEALLLAQGKAQGWTFYLSTLEVWFEVWVRLVVAALAGITLGTIATLLIAPILGLLTSSRERVSDWTIKISVIVVVFLVSRLALENVIKWSYGLGSHRALYDKALYAAFLLGFVVALLVPRSRKEILTSLDGFLRERMTRRIAIATVVATLALVLVEFGFSKATPTVRAATPQQHSKSNVLLITFDALNAEDMSLYGRELPTTPYMDAFARKGTVFKNFFSTSSFTTSSLASMMTGTFPSENYVYQLQGQLRANDLVKTVPHAMQEVGYITGAFLSNPYAYYFSSGLRGGFNVIPEPHFQRGGLQRLWDATTPLHQDSGIGSRVDEYSDLAKVWNFLGQQPHDLPERYGAAETFDHARRMLAEMPDGYFVWVHVMAPHHPYLPDTADRGRFLHDPNFRTLEGEGEILWYPRYPPEVQNQMDERRLRYDEFIATADRAFGVFMSEMESTGKLQNTTVIVSADHGESFEGGVYRHKTPYLTRPVLHIPLIVRTPGQQDSRTVSVIADQTSLAPTILELAGLLKPDWMKGASLAPWLNRDGQGDGEGLAFSQYFERNSVFKPLHHGSLSVIDGRFQYVYYLDTHKGELRPLNEAQIWDLDRTAENPARAEQLRRALHNRFPDLIQ